MKNRTRARIPERPEDREMQEEIRGRTIYSLALLGRSFIYHGSGRFVDLIPPRDYDILEHRRAGR